MMCDWDSVKQEIETESFETTEGNGYDTPWTDWTDWTKEEYPKEEYHNSWDSWDQDDFGTARCSWVKEEEEEDDDDDDDDDAQKRPRTESSHVEDHIGLESCSCRTQICCAAVLRSLHGTSS